MNSTKQIKFYSQQCISLMSRYESTTKKLMSEMPCTSDLEKAVWNASDEKDLIRLRALHARLCRLVDGVENE
jgi:hypothetical protein